MENKSAMEILLDERLGTKTGTPHRISNILIRVYIVRDQSVVEYIEYLKILVFRTFNHKHIF